MALKMTDATKALFTVLEKATAAVNPKDLADGRPQNPLASMHWTLEDFPGGYKMQMMRHSLVIAQKTLDRHELFEGKNKVNEDAVTAVVLAMFENVPAPAKAA